MPKMHPITNLRKHPYYRVRYDASEKPGELIFAVQYTVWIPEGEDSTGSDCTPARMREGSCRSGQTGAFDLHWLWRKSIIAHSYLHPTSNHKRQIVKCGVTKERLQPSISQSIIDLAKLTIIPNWLQYLGHSGVTGGGHWAGGMVMPPKESGGAWLRSSTLLHSQSRTPNCPTPSATRSSTQCPHDV